MVCNIKKFKFNLLELRKKIKYSKNDPTSFYPSHNITSSSILPYQDKIQSARYPINEQNRYPINHQNHSPKIKKSKIKIRHHFVQNDLPKSHLHRYIEGDILIPDQRSRYSVQIPKKKTFEKSSLQHHFFEKIFRQFLERKNILIHPQISQRSSIIL